MKIAGFTFIRNAVKNDYAIVEAITSILPICDEFVVAVDEGEFAGGQLKGDGFAFAGGERYAFETDEAAYDQQRVGWKITRLEPDAAKKTAPHEQRRITKTSHPGRGNQGHTFGDKLTPDERQAVLEYLKTL